MKKKQLPGRCARIVSLVLALLLTVVLTAGCFARQVNTVLRDGAMHRSIALDGRVVDAQMARIQARVQELADMHSFQPETVMSLVTRESVEQYNLDVIDWWMGLVKEDPTIAVPAWNTSAIEKAVREDPLFIENTPTALRRTTARDAVAYEVGRAVTKAVMPVRGDLLALILPEVLERVNVPVYMNYLALVPQVCWIAAGVLALLILLVMLRRVSFAGLYVGTGVAASGLCVAGVALMLSTIGLNDLIREISTLLAMQTDMLFTRIMIHVGLYTAAALAAGLALILLHRLDMKRLSCPAEDAQA